MAFRYTVTVDVLLFGSATFQEETKPAAAARRSSAEALVGFLVPSQMQDEQRQQCLCVALQGGGHNAGPAAGSR